MTQTVNFTTNTGWHITVTPHDHQPTVSLRAISAKRDRVINRKNINPDDIQTFDPDTAWANILTNSTKLRGAS